MPDKPIKAPLKIGETIKHNKLRLTRIQKNKSTKKPIKTPVKIGETVKSGNLRITRIRKK